MAKQKRRTYSPEQKTLILELYKQHGPAETSRILLREHKLDVPNTSIAAMARRAGIASGAGERTKAAVEAGALTLEQRRQRVAEKLLDSAERLVDRFNEVEVDHKGQQAKRVEYDEITFTSAKNAAQAIASLVDKAQLLTGGATSRNESVSSDDIGTWLEGYAQAFADGKKDEQPQR